MKKIRNLKILLTLIFIISSKITNAKEKTTQKQEYNIPISISADFFKSEDAFF